MTVFTKTDALFYLSEDGSSCTIPDTFTSVGDSAFNNVGDEFESLKTVVIPDSITSIGDCSFCYCKFETIHLPNSILSIGNGAFYSTALVSIILPNKLTSCGRHCFSCCSSLASSIEIPNSLTSLPYGMFYDCRNLTSLTIPPSVNEIGGYCFQNCSSLKSIIIPDAAIDDTTTYGLDTDNDDDNEFYDPFEDSTLLEATARSFDMSVTEYFRSSHQKKLKEDRIRFRVVLLTCLDVYQKMYEAPSAVAERDKRRKLITEGDNSANISCNFESYEISAEMKLGLPPQMLAIINLLENKIKASANELRREYNSKIETVRRESDSKNEALAKENKELRREINNLKKVDRNEMHLNAPLAYKMITAFELWREICSFL